MKNWFRNKLRAFIFPETESGSSKEPSNAIISRNTVRKNTLSIRDSVGLDDHEHNPIRFSVYSASGGKIVEAKLYDEKNDRWNSSLHVIDSSEDFGAAVGKIVFMEMLKKG